MTLERRLVATAPGVLAWEPVALRVPGTGEALVRTRLSAVSVASELGLLRDGPFPARLGYQTLGTVEETGEDVGLEVGQRVVCTAGHVSAGVYRVEDLIFVPDGVPDRVALAAILGEETHKGIRRVAPQASERVLVAGAGLLGLLCIYNLTRRGVGEVEVLEPDPARRALALELGAQAVWTPGSLPHDRYDVALECSAAPAGFAEALGHLRPGGRCVVLSDGNWGALALPPAFHARELSVVASSDGEDYPAYARWLWAHADPVLERLFEATVRPDELPAALGRLREWPRPVSLVVDWGADPILHP